MRLMLRGQLGAQPPLDVLQQHVHGSLVLGPTWHDQVSMLLGRKRHDTALVWVACQHMRGLRIQCRDRCSSMVHYIKA